MAVLSKPLALAEGNELSAPLWTTSNCSRCGKEIYSCSDCGQRIQFRFRTKVMSDVFSIIQKFFQSRQEPDVDVSASPTTSGTLTPSPTPQPQQPPQIQQPPSLPQLQRIYIRLPEAFNPPPAGQPESQSPHFAFAEVVGIGDINFARCDMPENIFTHGGVLPFPQEQPWEPGPPPRRAEKPESLDGGDQISMKTFTSNASEHGSEAGSRRLTDEDIKNIRATCVCEPGWKCPAHW